MRRCWRSMVRAARVATARRASVTTARNPNISFPGSFMRRVFCFLMILSLGAVAPLYAQDGDKKDDKKEEKKEEKKKKEKKPIARIVDVQVGYRSNNPGDPSSRYKVGLWAPVYVTIEAGEDGLPVKGRGECFIQVETIDSEETGTTYTVRPISVEAEKAQTFVAYVKAGNLGAETKVS